MDKKTRKSFNVKMQEELANIKKNNQYFQVMYTDVDNMFDTIENLQANVDEFIKNNCPIVARITGQTVYPCILQTSEYSDTKTFLYLTGPMSDTSFAICVGYFDKEKVEEKLDLFDMLQGSNDDDLHNKGGLDGVIASPRECFNTVFQNIPYLKIPATKGALMHNEKGQETVYDCRAFEKGYFDEPIINIDINSCFASALYEVIDGIPGMEQGKRDILELYDKRKENPNLKHMFNFSVGFFAKIDKERRNTVLKKYLENFHSLLTEIESLGGKVLLTNVDGMFIKNITLEKLQGMARCGKGLGQFKIANVITKMHIASSGKYEYVNVEGKHTVAHKGNHAIYGLLPKGKIKFGSTAFEFDVYVMQDCKTYVVETQNGERKVYKLTEFYDRWVDCAKD